MSSFPKKYKTQDLRNRAKIYRDNKQTNNNNSSSFFINTLPISQKLSYNTFFQKLIFFILESSTINRYTANHILFK